VPADRGATRTDPRVTRTRGLIEDAFLAVMQEKGFEGLSVQDVADRAGINRVTFYSHFVDTYALLRHAVRKAFEAEVVSRGLAERALDIESTGICSWPSAATLLAFTRIASRPTITWTGCSGRSSRSIVPSSSNAGRSCPVGQPRNRARRLLPPLDPPCTPLHRGGAGRSGGALPRHSWSQLSRSSRGSSGSSRGRDPRARTPARMGHGRTQPRSTRTTRAGMPCSPKKRSHRSWFGRS
jgi:AcrR family transcriptional regulator